MARPRPTVLEKNLAMSGMARKKNEAWHGPRPEKKLVPCHGLVLLHRRLLTVEFSSTVGSSSIANSGATLQSLLLSCAANYSDEVVRSFISNIKSLSIPVESQRQAAMVLRLLAKHKPENHFKITRVGAVRPLVALISHPDPQLQEHGVTAILNLSLCDENKDPIAAAGAIYPLIRALKTGTPAVRENAAFALL